MIPSGIEQHALKSRLLADLAQAMAAGHPLQVGTVAVLLGCRTSELMCQALGTATASGPGADERLQLYLRKVVRVVSIAQRHFGDIRPALQWYAIVGGAQRLPSAAATASADPLADACRILLATPLPSSESNR